MNFAELLLPDFSLILVGYLLCRFTALNRSLWSQLERLVYFFLFPLLLFHTIVKNPLDLSATSSLMAAGLTLGIAAIGLSYSLRWWPLLGRYCEARLHAASAQVGFRFNSFIALALADKATGSTGLPLIAMLIGVCVPLFNVGAVWPMARQAGRGFVRELVRNPLIIGTACGLLANVLGFAWPNWLEPTAQRLGQASLVLGLMAAGAGMQLGSLGSAKVLGLAVLSVKHLVMPLMALGLGLLFRLDPTQASVLLMFSAVPTASSCYVLAARMGYNGPYVAGLVTLSTLLGLLSLPFALVVLRPLLY